MVKDTCKRFYLQLAGSVGAEMTPRSWDEIVAMCRSGHLQPDSLILFDEENEWKKAADTELAAFFAERDASPEEADGTHMEEEYSRLRDEAESSPGDWSKRIQLAEMAIKLGDRPAALRYFQEALDHNRFHPPVARKAKRCLSRDEWQTLRYLSRPAPIWSAPFSLIGFPLARGPLYLLIPTIVLSALFWLPGVSLIGGVLVYLWVAEVIRTAARGAVKPPLWHDVLSDPVDTVLRPLGVALIVGVELYVPFLLFAVVIAMVGDGDSYAWTVIQESPVMIVLMSTITLLYLPAVLVIAGKRHADVRRIASPRHVIEIIIKMEHEYIVSLGIIAALIATWGLLTYVLTLVPYAGHVAAVALGVYVVVAAGLVVGRLQSRFNDELG
jgi:hypothetical protein